MEVVSRLDHTANSRHTDRTYMVWDDGTRLYDDEGFAQPNKLMHRFGVTAFDLASLGADADFTDVYRRAAQIITQKNPTLTEEDILVAQNEINQR
ncbi:hypothetical protein QFE97_08245 [Bacillus subtilis]|nr:hypothetical protein QFE97_08245 [Bacillus subtilis]